MSGKDTNNRSNFSLSFNIFNARPAKDSPGYTSLYFHPKTNLYKRMIAECGACEDKMRIARVAKERNLDAIHDTVHEMAKDEARHGKGFEGLYNRYFKK